MARRQRVPQPHRPAFSLTLEMPVLSLVTLNSFSVPENRIVGTGVYFRSGSHRKSPSPPPVPVLLVSAPQTPDLPKSGRNLPVRGALPAHTPSFIQNQNALGSSQNSPRAGSGPSPRAAELDPQPAGRVPAVSRRAAS